MELRLFRGKGLYSLWGTNGHGEGHDILLARRGRILLFPRLNDLRHWMVAENSHNMAKWSNFQRLQGDTRSARLTLNRPAPFLYDFPAAVATVALLKPGCRITHSAQKNLLDTLNLLWDATTMLRELHARKLLTPVSALGRLADILTFRDMARERLWRRRMPRIQMRADLLFLIGTLAEHCELVR